MFDVADPDRLVLEREIEGVDSFQFSPSGPELVARRGEEFLIIDYLTGEERALGQQGHLRPCYVGESGERVALVDSDKKSIKVVRASSGEPVGRFSVGDGLKSIGRIRVSGSGKYVAVCFFRPPGFEVYELDGGERVLGPGARGDVRYEYAVWDAAYS